MQLRAIRISNGYTIEQVANHCDVSPETISKYEINPSKIPLYLIMKLSKLYKISPNVFIINGYNLIY